jgi:ATP-dependent RNA helicase RhlE
MTTQIQFAGLGLAEPLLRAVTETGYTIPTPIQAKAIPLVLEGGDLLAAAQTGTGKTAGFVLPILHRLHTTPLAGAVKPGRPRCLILTPTRELAAQVEESVQTYGRHVPVKSMVMFGGVGIQPQVAQLRKRLDILVATPGRLLDHVGQKTLDLSGVEILVLDEGDRMLDMGFIHDIKRILKLLPNKRQSMLFSATFSEDVRALANQLLNSPGCVDVAPRNTASELVEQVVHLVAKDQKRDLLSHLIRENKWTQVLVFTRTKHGANRLAEKLERDGIPAAAIHGNKSQGARTRALAQFKAGEVPVLVATDIAARGLDIEELPHVVNFELPNVPEDYVHRIGRTGRAGSTGWAVSLVDSEEVPFLRAIEKLIKRPIDRSIVEGFVAKPVQDADREDERSEREPRRHGRDARRPAREPREPRRSPQPAAAAPRQRTQAQHGAPAGSGNGARHQQRRSNAGNGRGEFGNSRNTPGSGRSTPGNARSERGNGRSEQSARRHDAGAGRNRPVRDDSFGNRIHGVPREEVDGNRARPPRNIQSGEDIGNRARPTRQIEPGEDIGNRVRERPQREEVDGNRAPVVRDIRHVDSASEAARHQSQPQPALFSPRPQQRSRRG